MATNTKVCDVDPEVKALVKEFRFRKTKNNAAIVLKIDKEKLMIVEEETYEDVTPEDLQDELPARQPRYIVYSYVHKHDDGRQSYPLCFISLQPAGCKPEQAVMYSGSARSLISEIGVTKTFEIRDLEDFTEEWLIAKLGFFR